MVVGVTRGTVGVVFLVLLVSRLLGTGVRFFGQVVTTSEVGLWGGPCLCEPGWGELEPRVRPFVRLRMRARCSLLSKRTSVSTLVSGTRGSNVPTVTIASRNIVFKVGRFFGGMSGGGNGPLKTVGSCRGRLGRLGDGARLATRRRTHLRRVPTGVRRRGGGVFGPVFNYRYCYTHGKQRDGLTSRGSQDK